MHSMGYTFLIVGIFAIGIVLYEISQIIWCSILAIRAGKRAQPVSQKISSPRKRILVIGDSTSYGTGATQPQYSLVGRLVRAYPDIEVTNESENAMDLKQLARKLSDIQETYDMVIIHIGGIDTLKFTSNRKMEQLFERIHLEIQRLAIPTTLLVTVNNVGLAPFMHLMSACLYRMRSKRMHQFFVRIAKKYNFHHVSLYEMPGNDLLAQDATHLFSKDRIHPSDAGYGIWYEKINHTLKPLLS